MARARSEISETVAEENTALVEDIAIPSNIICMHS